MKRGHRPKGLLLAFLLFPPAILPLSCDRFSLVIDMFYPEGTPGDPRGSFEDMELTFTYQDGTIFKVFTGGVEGSLSVQGIPAGYGVTVTGNALSPDPAYEGNYQVVASGATFPVDLEGEVEIPLILAKRGILFESPQEMGFQRVFHTIDGTREGYMVMAGGIEKVSLNSEAIPSIELADLMDHNYPFTVYEGGELNDPRYGHCSSPVSGTGTGLDGAVLFFGGASRYIESGSLEIIDSIEAFRPHASSVEEIGETLHHRLFPRCTTLDDGVVLITGGFSRAYYETVREVEIFDPELFEDSGSGIYSGGDMEYGRVFHSATLLGDGKILIAGGIDETGTPLISAEVISEGGGYLTGLAMNYPRFGHGAVQIDYNRVLIAGGFMAFDIDTKSPEEPTATAEVFDLSTGTFTLLQEEMNDMRGNFVALNLPATGYVLIAGGRGDQGTLKSIEYFDPITCLFFPDGENSLLEQRESISGTILPNGMVSLSGGFMGIKGSTLIELMVP